MWSWHKRNNNKKKQQCVKSVRRHLFAHYRYGCSSSSSKNMCTQTSTCSNWDTEMLSTVYFCILGIRQGRTLLFPFLVLYDCRVIVTLTTLLTIVCHLIGRVEWGYMTFDAPLLLDCCGWPNNLSLLAFKYSIKLYENKTNYKLIHWCNNDDDDDAAVKNTIYHTSSRHQYRP